ncbi:CAP domain-containing protein [Massilia sp.]|uniref:CAP domain-containing protein n=1 Tax=Massilia sp. TaxID=1882437 RepID=UPI0028A01E14|nr:CAP domain-containing protein [Massilia sp.]
MKAILFLIVIATSELLTMRPALAQNESHLVNLINTWRASPDDCGGSNVRPAPALNRHPALARVRIGPGSFPESALEQVGYYAGRAEVIHVGGAPDAEAALEAIRTRYCRTLLDRQLQDIGVARRGNEWTIVLARPAPPLVLPDQLEAGRTILALVNEARATARHCGSRYFHPARPVDWNDALAQAAREHSSDMAAHRRFSHRGSDDSEVAQRATRAGYRWRHIGENIAAGQTSAQEAVAGWLESPGHCANLMNPAFSEMGAGYAISRARMPGFAYWTQVFAMP